MWIAEALAAKFLTTPRLARAPIPLYRHGLGWIFGQRILLLEHVGRRSGQLRYVCLEVVDRPAPDRLVIASGFGTRAQWYQNLLSDPGCSVSVGRRRRVRARARPMSQHESRSTLTRYRQVHPRAWKQLRGAIERAVGHPVEDLPMMELTLQG